MRILVCVLLIVTIVDIATYKIPNLWIGFGMLAGLVQTAWLGGMAGIGAALGAMAVIFCIAVPFYLLRGIGAGDCKLFMMLACFFSKEQLLHCLALSLLLAGILAVGKIICYRQGRERLYYLGRYLRKGILMGAWDTYETPGQEKRSVVRLSLPTLIAAIGVMSV